MWVRNIVLDLYHNNNDHEGQIFKNKVVRKDVREELSWDRLIVREKG